MRKAGRHSADFERYCEDNKIITLCIWSRNKPSDQKLSLYLGKSIVINLLEGQPIPSPSVQHPI
ncbi:Uncharacterized protein HZ326_23165, partial [Fusarium oxysporum f. sp. albedinis]